MAGAAHADKVAYSSGSQVIIQNVDGSGERVLVRGAFLGGVSLTHDERAVVFTVFTQPGGEPRLYRVESDGSGLRPITFPGLDQIFAVDCSPVDGRLAISARDAAGEQGIYVANADGSEPRLLRRVSHVGDLKWRSDGAALVAVEDLFGDELEAQALLLEPSGALIRSFPLRAHQEGISWSARGDFLVFIGRAANRIENSSYLYEIYSIRADGSGLRRLTFERGWQRAPALSPDGRQMVYLSEFGGLDGSTIQLLDIESGATHTLPWRRPSITAGGLTGAFPGTMDWGPLPLAPLLAPSIRIAAPANGGIASRIAEIRGLVVDANGARDLGSLDVSLRLANGPYWNGRAFQGGYASLPTVRSPLSTSPNGMTWSVSSLLPAEPQLREGLYVVEARATDKAGLATRSVASLRVDTTPPQVAISTANFNGSRSTLAGTWRDAWRVASVRVHIRRADGQHWNGRAWQPASVFLPASLSDTNASGTGGGWSLGTDLPRLSDLGPYATLSIMAVDRAGNRATVQHKVGPVPSTARA